MISSHLPAEQGPEVDRLGSIPRLQPEPKSAVGTQPTEAPRLPIDSFLNKTVKILH